MKNLYNRISRNLKLPSKEKMKLAIYSFNKKEKIIFFISFFVLIFSTLAIMQSINNMFMVESPISGGSITEGIVGTPRFINPVLALSDADKDMTALVYSGLMRKSPSGNLIPDLAQSYEISNDGLSYTFVLKDNIYFHDNTIVTADDIVFTINAIKDPLNKSPIKNNWDGITIEKISEKTIKFILKQPYASFLENTTVGIMPAHLWNSSPIELNTANTNPVGSGPYQIKTVSKQSSGIIDYYNLKVFKKFILGKPYIKKVTLQFFPNEDELIKALKNGNVDQVGSVTPENAEALKQDGYTIESSILPRVFGLFFNQNQAQIFTDKNVVSAIDKAIDKEKIIEEVLKGYGAKIDGPIPQNALHYEELDNYKTTSREENIKKAKELLAKSGWVLGDDGFLQKKSVTKKGSKAPKTISSIAFTISTGNAPELMKTAELIQTDLQQIGMHVDVKTFEIGNLNQSVIRPRKYDTLLFGEIINKESDLFAFWHSSQRHDPGLNVAMYTNSKVDKILEDALVTLDEKNRVKKYAQFEDFIKNDMPAVFIYSPSFNYIVSKNVSGLSIDHITSPSDRFLNIYTWSVEKNKVWKIFSK